MAESDHGMREPLPTGTVTFFFTDLEGSTQLLQARGRQEYARLLLEHRRLLRDVVTAHAGRQTGAEGDAFSAVFESPGAAVAAAHEAQKGLDSLGVRARIGIHTGEGVVEDGGYVGLDVHRNARIMAAGHGGQTLISQATREHLDDTVVMRPLGEYWLKDLEQPERLYQLGDEQHPALRSLRRAYLPEPATPLVGRRREFAELTALLDDDAVRVITVTGPGGAGKTRLAQAAAKDAAPRYRDGTWWVSLTPLRDLESVWGVVAQVVGTRRALHQHLADQEALLCLDNAEHLPGIGADVAGLVAACPGVDVLVTSREPLGLAGEWVYLLEPLGLDEAVELFVTRAAAAGRTVAPDDEVRQICRRLDCLALTVELAAARIRVFSPQVILDRLDRELPVLGVAGGDAAEHQRTLDSTIRWSFDLLSELEQRLFTRLAVFAGGCSLGAAEQVCGAEVETLISLIDKQLVRQRDDRFWMLETIRRFARDRLSETGEAGALELRHAGWCAELCRQHEEALTYGGDSSALRVFDLEQHNIRVAITRALARDDAPSAIQLAAVLWMYLEPRGQITDARRILDTVLAQATDAELASEAAGRTVLWGASGLAGWQGDDAAARRVSRRFADVAAVRDDAIWQSWALLRIGILDLHGDPGSARESFEQARDLATASGDADVVGRANLELAQLALVDGDLPQATELAGMALASPGGSRPGYMHDAAVFTLAFVALEQSDPVRSRDLLEPMLISWLQAGVAMLQDELSCLAATWVAEDPERGARLIGAAEAAADASATPIGTLWALVGERHRETARALHATLGGDGFDQLVSEGRAMPAASLLSITPRHQVAADR